MVVWIGGIQSNVVLHLELSAIDFSTTAAAPHYALNQEDDGEGDGA